MQLKHFTLAVTITTSLAILSGCATVPYQPYAREVKKLPQTSGIIALNANHQEEDRAKAENMMRGNCGNMSVKILEEGEIATGTQTNTASKETKDRENEGGFKTGIFTFGGAPKDSNNTATNAVTTEIKEWRISYSCVAAAKEAPQSLKTLKKTAKAGNKTTSEN